MNENSISVVIPAYNAEKTLSLVLKSVLNQEHANSPEVIVVDDGSTDATPVIVKGFNVVRYIRQDNAGPAAARNRGFKESKGKFVFFTDSDCIPAPDWIIKGVRHFDDSAVAVVAGSYDIANGEHWLARFIHSEIIYRHRHLMPKFPRSFGSYNFAIRREVFEAVQGFDTSYRHPSGEDNDLSYKVLKAGYRIYFEKESRVKHFYPTNLQKYLSEQCRHGFWRVKIYLEHPRMSLGDDYTFWKDILEPPAVLAILFSVFLTIGVSAFFQVWLTAMLLTMLAIEFFYSLVFTKSLAEGVFGAVVMSLRAFARTFGFVAGFFYFFLPKFLKKN